MKTGTHAWIMKTSCSWFYRLASVVSIGIASYAYGQTPPTLQIRANGERVDLIFTDAHMIEAAGEITGPWVSLGSQTSPFTQTYSIGTTYGQPSGPTEASRP